MELVSDLDEFFAERIDVELEELTNIANTLNEEGKYNKIDINEVLSSQVYAEFVKNDGLSRLSEDGYVRLPNENESVSVQDAGVTDVHSIKVHKLEDGSAIIDCEIEAIADIEFFIFKGDSYMFDNNKALQILDREWNDYYYLASDQIQIKAKATMRVSEGFYRVLSREIRVKDASRLKQ